MKKLVLQSVVCIFVSLLLLTSCIEEGGNVQDKQAFGIVRFDYETGKNVLDVTNDDITIYSSRFQNDFDDNCFFVTYRIDYDDEQNSAKNVEAREYWNVSVYDHMPASRNYLASTIDTSNVLPNEVPLEDAFVGMEGYIRYFKGKLFMFSTLRIPEDQKMDWHMSYDKDNMLSEEYGQRYYNLFLRSTIRVEETGSKVLVGIPNAFEIKRFFEEAAQKEKELGGSSFSLRFNYPTAIGEDGQITWGHQDMLDVLRIEEVLE